MFSAILPSRVFLLSAILIIGSALCQAQTNTTQIKFQGKVLDPNHAAVPGAKVSATAKNRPNEVTTVTNQYGEFSFTLPPSEYTLKVSANGFSENSQTISIAQSNSAAIEVVLQVAASSATVNVVDAANYQTDVVTSATKTTTPLRDIPQAVTVITKEQFKDQMFQSLGDALRYTPGVAVHQGENNRDEAIIRGQDTSSSFFLNGVRDDVQYYRDPYNTERLETLKGPNAMIFGRGGGGGVINRVTKEANFSPLREISIEGGSYYNRRISGDFDQPLGDKVALRLNTVYENSDSFRKYVFLHRFAINPTMTFTPDKNTRITIGYEFARDRRTAERGIPSFLGQPVDIPINTFFGNPDLGRLRSNISILTGSFDHQIGKFNIHNRTTYGDYDRKYQNVVPGAVNSTATSVALTAYNNATVRKNFFNQTDLTYNVSTGSVQHTLLGGVELGRQLTNNFRNTGFFNNTATTISVPLSNPTISTPITFRQSATDADNHLKTNLVGTYAQDQMAITRYFQVVLGLRYDYFDLQYHDNRTNNNLRRIDNLVSPRVGVVIKPVTELSIYGNYSVSYLPSSGDQFSSLTTITQQVKPEKFTNYEVGVKWDVRRNLSLTSAIYRLDRTNTRATDPNNPTAIIQTGSERTNGFEVGFNGTVLPKWSISGGYNYQNAFITSATTAALAGKQVGQVPHHTFSMWNKYQLLSKLGVGLGVTSRTDMFVAVDNTVVLPGYARADGAVFYSFNEKWRIQANVENLFGQVYYINADGNNNISPGSSRAIKVGLIARF